MQVAGDCLFLSLSFLLSHLNVNNQQVRRSAVQYVQSHWNEITDTGFPLHYLTENAHGFYVSPELYGREIGKYGTYAGTAEIYAISQIYFVKFVILVYSPTQMQTVTITPITSEPAATFNLRRTGRGGNGHFEPYLPHTHHHPKPWNMYLHF